MERCKKVRACFIDIGYLISYIDITIRFLIDYSNISQYTNHLDHPQRTASVAALPVSFEIGNLNHQTKGQIVGKLSLNNTNVSSGFPYRLLSPSGGHINNIQNSPLSLQPCTSSFSNTVSAVNCSCLLKYNLSSTRENSISQ